MMAQQAIDSGLNFLSGLKSNQPGWYWEVADQRHPDHRIWPQSQYLLYITFKRFGRFDQANEIYLANDFKACAVDREIHANSRFCVLDNDAPPFYLASWSTAQLPNSYDEVALLGHYLALKGSTQEANRCGIYLKDKWNSQFRILGMDEGDRAADQGRGLFRLYKTALAGTLFARIGMIEDCQSTASELQTMQDSTGGWITDLNAQGRPSGVPNIETTCLTLVCLDCASKRRFSAAVT